MPRSRSRRKPRKVKSSRKKSVRMRMYDSGEKDSPRLSEQTKEVLAGWLSGGLEVKEFTDEQVAELIKYRPLWDVPMRLYRGCKPNDVVTEDGSIVLANEFSSWTYDPVIAKRFAERGRIASGLFRSDNVLIDTTILDPRWIFYYSGFPEEKEVIMMPGIYKIRMEA